MSLGRMKCYNSKNQLKEPLQTFQKGILFSIKSLKSLYEDMKERFGLTYIMTHRLNQDCLENFFSQVRGKTRFIEHPTPVECLYNIRAIILGKNPGAAKQSHLNTIDKLPDEYVTSEFCKYASTIPDESSVDDDSGDELESLLGYDEHEDDEECDEMFQECTSTSTEDGIEYIAGWIQKKLNYGHPNFSRAPKPSTTTQSLNTSFIDDVSLGGLTKPDDLILNMVRNMENTFFQIHGKTFTKQANIRRNLASTLKQKYPEIPSDIVDLFARSRIYFRCSYMNKKAHEEAVAARIEKRKAKAEGLKIIIAAQQAGNIDNLGNNEPMNQLHSLETNAAMECQQKRVASTLKKKSEKIQKKDEVPLHSLQTNAVKKKSKQERFASAAKKKIEEKDAAKLLSLKSNAAKNKLIQKRPSSVPTKEDISLRSMEKYDKKRTASVPLHSLETYDNFEKFASDIERRKRRKLKKFST